MTVEWWLQESRMSNEWKKFGVARPAAKTNLWTCKKNYDYLHVLRIGFLLVFFNWQRLMDWYKTVQKREWRMTQHKGQHTRTFRQLGEVHYSRHIRVEWFKALFVGFQVGRLIVDIRRRVWEIKTSLRVVVILSTSTDNIRIWYKRDRYEWCGERCGPYGEIRTVDWSWNRDRSSWAGIYVTKRIR